MKLNAYFLQEFGVILCKGCGDDFKPHFRNQTFCKTQCRIDYTNENRKELYGVHPMKYENKFPKWTCEDCNTTIQLDFHPIKQPQKLKELKCKKCYGD